VEQQPKTPSVEQRQAIVLAQSVRHVCTQPCMVAWDTLAEAMLVGRHTDDDIETARAACRVALRNVQSRREACAVFAAHAASASYAFSPGHEERDWQEALAQVQRWVKLAQENVG
jgi:hypothetical protein